MRYLGVDIFADNGDLRLNGFQDFVNQIIADGFGLRSPSTTRLPIPVQLVATIAKCARRPSRSYRLARATPLQKRAFMDRTN